MAQAPGQNWQALLFTVVLHAGFLGLVWLASVWVLPSNEQAAAGEPVQASLSFSADDLARARKAVAEAEAQRPQPKPEPRPQTSLQPLQQTAQDWIDQPDDTVQEQVERNAALPSDAQREQARKRKQGQVELTEDVKKAEAEENRQRLIRQQLAQVQKERARLQADIEAKKLDALAGTKAPAPPAKPQTAGQAGASATGTAKYLAAINATARANWNTVQIPQQTRCQVEFTQIRGGEVIDVAFLSCPLDMQGRESIERALYKSPMPYAGFEAVFQRKVTLTFCYPDEVCR